LQKKTLEGPKENTEVKTRQQGNGTPTHSKVYPKRGEKTLRKGKLKGKVQNILDPGGEKKRRGE